MKIAILGATGSVGRATLRAALDAGHPVTAHVRRPEAVPRRPGAAVVGGLLADVPAMAAAFAGADAIIHAAGASTDRFSQRTLPAITAAAQQAGVGRFVLVSGFGVGETRAWPRARPGSPATPW